MPTPYHKKSQAQRAMAHAATKRWGEKNPEKKAEYRRKHYLENRDKYLRIERDRAYRKRYGITIENYESMLATQGGVCLICKRDRASATGKFRFFSVDHCHATGRVRGLLCTKCNGTLGWYEKYTQSILNYLGDSK